MTNPAAIQRIGQAAVEQWEELDLSGMGVEAIYWKGTIV
jgi:hypothetical protein